ncbi:MAG: sulfite exporter TauE/SafE family protein [Turicibacter sp.]|nr:sulfite exporter TauE/SafE family protein [Turicibacter sp.]
MIGAVVGLGGGVIIRPVFDILAIHNMLNIAFFSSAAIVTMSISSTLKKVKDGTKIEPRTAILISCGAILGGTFGNLFLEFLLDFFETQTSVQLIQTISTIFFLLLAIYLTQKGNLRYNVKHMALYPIIGVFLGTLAVFLGIGGGPINVPLFVILFNLSVKAATAYSIVVIFFSHSFRLITMGFTTGFAYFDVGYLVFILPAAILGGILGSMISKNLSDNMVKKAFLLTMLVLIGVNIYNGLMFGGII